MNYELLKQSRSFGKKCKIIIFFIVIGITLGKLLFKNFVIGAVIGFFVGLKFAQWQESKQTRYIPDYIKKAVLNRYYHMCAVCPEPNLLHHKTHYAEGGDNSEKNIVCLCPKHHSMVRRLENDTLPK